MTKLFLYNTLSRRKEEFKPIKAGAVGLYTCGPTVYNYAHLGNLRSYLFEDFLVRILQYNGYAVRRVMNITDVGHLTGDRDMGEDKVEAGAARTGKSAWKITEFFATAFKQDLVALNILAPDIWCKATDHLPEQIAMIKILEDKGYTYKTADGIYFDTAKVPDYNKLSHLPLEELKEGARVEKNPEKKNPTDFALWKFSPSADGGRKRQMEWDSPWGVGFPGWHIECSAMSLKYLQNQLDIHCGGIDHINIHHTNEIAQSEAATGKKFFNYWMHNAFLNIAGGKKMAKSEDNFLTLEKTFIEKGIDPLAYRFAALQVHYRKPMEYSEEGMRQAESGLKNLRLHVKALGDEQGKVNHDFKEEFLGAINNDLNMPEALAIVSSVLKSKLSEADKSATILEFDKVLGLDLNKAGEGAEQILELTDLPALIQEMILKRQIARQERNWELSDQLRKDIEDSGYIMEDAKSGYILRKRKE
ncbi:TPA: cysteine--tRNA ligase [Candidatus Falkowbacteria bacterium]|nr:MAG: Cysteine-tRNA ligase [Candidatus Falkowbacteria bacterium GW2011_GWF2_43_32]HBA36473.1 cysteine--tRNA ligase [Candidatus Falkowbacteria bacterium]